MLDAIELATAGRIAEAIERAPDRLRNTRKRVKTWTDSQMLRTLGRGLPGGPGNHRVYDLNEAYYAALYNEACKILEPVAMQRMAKKLRNSIDTDPDMAKAWANAKVPSGTSPAVFLAFIHDNGFWDQQNPEPLSFAPPVMLTDRETAQSLMGDSPVIHSILNLTAFFAKTVRFAD